MSSKEHDVELHEIHLCGVDAINELTNEQDVGHTLKRIGQSGKATPAKIAEIPEPDRAMASQFREIIKASASDLWPKTRYEMIECSNDGEVVCIFQDASRFNTRYAALQIASYVGE